MPEYYLNEQLKRAEQNMRNGLLDREEFIIKGVQENQEEILNKLKNQWPKNTNANFLHGDFRPKNIILSNNNYYVLDFGLSHIGDYYYDLSIFLYYLNEEEKQMFLKEYGIENLDKEKLQYYEYLSKYLNV